MRDGLTLDGILLVVKGEDDLGDMGVGGGRVPPTKKTNSWSGRNWTVLRYPVQLVYSHEHKQK